MTDLKPILAKAGIGLRSEHYLEVLDQKPDIPWLEVHSENYFGGGLPLKILEEIRQDYPLSFHGVALSLGSATGIAKTHLQRLKKVIDRFQPALVSEHLAWTEIHGIHLNDLLPVPYTEEALDIVCRNIDYMQTYLGRQILAENPSTYLEFEASEISEPVFLAEMARRTGCKLLLDVNNIYVSAQNHGFDPLIYIKAIPPEFVGEMHLAGHAQVPLGERVMLIDDHGSRVKADVWDLFKYALEHVGPQPVLIEWDTDIPTLETLVGEAQKAQSVLDSLTQKAAAYA